MAGPLHLCGANGAFHGARYALCHALSKTKASSTLPSHRSAHADPEAEAKLNADMTRYLAAIEEGAGKSEGIKIGEAVAARVLEARAGDGSNALDAYRPKAKPGVYVATPITVGSVWPKVRPFVMTN